LLLLAAIAVLVGTLAMPVRNWFSQRAELATLEAEVAAAEIRVADLLVQQERWQDPAFIAAEARRRLHFVFPGEVGYVALGADGRPAEETLSEVAKVPVTWYSAVFDSVSAADKGEVPAIVSEVAAEPEPPAEPFVVAEELAEPPPVSPEEVTEDPPAPPDETGE
jgi:hypothetical protein